MIGILLGCVGFPAEIAESASIRQCENPGPNSEIVQSGELSYSAWAQKGLSLRIVYNSYEVDAEILDPKRAADSQRANQKMSRMQEIDDITMGNISSASSP
ncbi:unnamed protein product [Toxocara canis]|uniref:Lipoprotein n=1 Tax=Toxocara canis TaxID=6265 RepID=A0A183VDP9_TOXCA|nr:unnamed protein product [Toxocara canis]